MIAKRRITSMRVCCICGILIVIMITKLWLFNNHPLDLTERVSHAGLQQNQQREKSVSLSEAHKKQKQGLTSCKLFMLREGQLSRDTYDNNDTLCKRMQPLPGSCDVADNLFHTSPLASCKHQKAVEICNLFKASKGYAVRCSSDVCDLALSAAVPDTTSGKLLWRRFESAAELEKWTNRLLQPARGRKKHFGFCFISCGGDWTNTDGETVDVMNDSDTAYDSPLQATQLLLLPPSLPSFPQTDILSRVPSNVSQKHGLHTSDSQSNPYSGINVNMIFVDSVSRQHFFRSLPQTVKLLQGLVSGNIISHNKAQIKSSQSQQWPDVSVFDFELVQSVRSRTFETLQMLFSGEIDPSVTPFGVLELPPEALKVEGMWKQFKDQGYTTLWLEDLCYLWEWGLSKDLLVHNKTLSAEETWKDLQSALEKGSIDSLEITYAMCRVLSENGVKDHFHGPNAVCFNGKHQHEYLLEFLWLYQDVMAQSGVPYFTLMETNVGHEDSGKRIQTLDASFQRYLRQVLTQGNTMTIIFSDHGNSYGAFVEKSVEARIELFHPHLFVLVPRQVGELLGREAMRALEINQRRLVSHLDLHYMLQSLASNFRNAVQRGHSPYNVTSRGLLQPVWALRTCQHIPRIMPNLCICQDFDTEVPPDAYHALFAHLAVGSINNLIQRQRQQQALADGVRAAQGFGRCRHLLLADFDNVRISFHGATMSLKMYLYVSVSHQLIADDVSEEEDYYNQTYSQLPESQAEVFFVALQADLGRRTHSSNSIILQTLDRITPYSHFGVCADKAVKLQLCICDIKVPSKSGAKKENTFMDSGVRKTENLNDPEPGLRAKDRKAESKNGESPQSKDGTFSSEFPTVDSLTEGSLFVKTEVLIADGTDECLVLVVKKNEHGGMFSVVNLCKDRVFQIMFTLETSEMFVSDASPKEETVYPGQEIFLVMAVKTAPKVKWDWSYTLQQKWQRL